MVKKQRNKKKIYSKKRVLRGGVDATAIIDANVGLHSILDDAETLYPDALKEVKLTHDACYKWFHNIRNHAGYHFLKNKKTNTLKRNKDREVEKATKNARSAVKFCESRYQVRLDEDVKDLVTGVVPSQVGDSEMFQAIGTLEHPLPDVSIGSDDDDGYVVVSSEIVNPEIVNPDVTSIEETELSQQTDRTLAELRGLIVAGNRGYDYINALAALANIFYKLRQKLFTNIKKYPFELKIYKQITEFFKHIKFNIIPRNEIRLPKDNVVGFFIGIEKHSFTFFTSRVLFDSFSLFDEFVNSLMYAINSTYNVDPSSDNPIIIFNQPKDGNPSVGGDKRLFLVLTGVAKNYEDLIKKHSIKKPNLNIKCKLELSEFGLPDNIFFHLEDNYNVFYPNDTPAASSLRYGGSKSRRKNIHKSKVKTHRHRRGSKSKSRRRSHSRARKHKKYTRRH